MPSYNNFIIRWGTLEKCLTKEKSVAVPEGVTEIETDAFMGSRHTLEEIELPDTLTDVGERAFSDCRKLKKINLPSNLIRIGRRAFYGCESLESLDVPNNVRHIGPGAFNKTPFFESLGEFASVNGILLLYRGEKTHVIVPDGIKCIDEYAFKRQPIEEVILPDTVVEIEPFAFSRCRNLKKITLPSSLKEIYGSTFFGCTSLEEIILPKSVCRIGRFNFKAKPGIFEE